MRPAPSVENLLRSWEADRGTESGDENGCVFFCVCVCVFCQVVSLLSIWGFVWCLLSVVFLCWPFLFVDSCLFGCLFRVGVRRGVFFGLELLQEGAPRRVEVVK